MEHVYIYIFTFFFETYFDFNRYSIIHVSVLMLNILDHLPGCWVPPSPNQAPYDWYDLHVAWSILCFSVLLESCQRLNKHLVIAPNAWYQPGLVRMNILMHKYMYLYYFILIKFTFRKISMCIFMRSKPFISLTQSWTYICCCYMNLFGNSFRCHLQRNRVARRATVYWQFQVSRWHGESFEHLWTWVFLSNVFTMDWVDVVLGFGCMLHGSYFLMNSWRRMTSLTWLVWRFGSSTVDKVVDSQVSCIVAPSLCVCRYGREQIAEFKVYTVMRSVRIPPIMWQWCFFLWVFNLHIWSTNFVESWNGAPSAESFIPTGITFGLATAWWILLQIVFLRCNIWPRCKRDYPKGAWWAIDVGTFVWSRGGHTMSKSASRHDQWGPDENGTIDPRSYIGNGFISAAELRHAMIHLGETQLHFERF